MTMNLSDIGADGVSDAVTIDYFASDLDDFDSSPNKRHGMQMVVMEMSLSFFAIVFNLIVFISIREKESLLESTVNMLLSNLCSANLVAAVFVKSIAVIYNGQAVAASLWEVGLPFCTIHTVTFRATWSVFPYTIVVMCWRGLVMRASSIFKARAKAQNVYNVHRSGESSKALVQLGYRTASIAIIDGQSTLTSPTDDKPEQPHGYNQTLMEMKELAEEEPIERAHSIEDKQESEDDEGGSHDGLDSRSKTALGFIWGVAAGYALMSRDIMSKERFVPCSVSQGLDDSLNQISLFVAIGVPLLLGPILCPVFHLVLTFCGMCSSGVSDEHESSLDAHHSHGADENQLTCKTCLLELSLIVSFSIVFLVTYPTHMYFTEVYLATKETHFAFMAFKHCFGCLHLVLLPIIILIVKADIRGAAVDILCKRRNNDQQAA